MDDKRDLITQSILFERNNLATDDGDEAHSECESRISEISRVIQANRDRTSRLRGLDTRFANLQRIVNSLETMGGRSLTINDELLYCIQNGILELCVGSDNEVRVIHRQEFFEGGVWYRRLYNYKYLIVRPANNHDYDYDHWFVTNGDDQNSIRAVTNGGCKIGITGSMSLCLSTNAMADRWCNYCDENKYVVLISTHCPDCGLPFGTGNAESDTYTNKYCGECAQWYAVLPSETTCSVCGFSFVSGEQVAREPCKYGCGQSFSDETQKSEHEEICTYRPQYHCKYSEYGCDYTQSIPDDVVNHEDTCSYKPVEKKCEHCFETSYVHQDQTTCPRCNRPFSKGGGDGDEYVYSCDACSPAKWFRSEGDLEDHIRSEHNTQMYYSCTEPGCSDSFVTMGELKEHLSQYHGIYNEGEGLRQCPKCGESVQAATDDELYQNHLSKCTGMWITDRECGVCGKTLPNTTYDMLIQHEATCEQGPGSTNYIPCPGKCGYMIPEDSVSHNVCGWYKMDY